MKHLNKFNDQEEQREYLENYSNLTSSRVCLIGNDLDFFDTSIPFYVEAVSDIVISKNSMSYRDYSFDGENWVDNDHSANALTIPAGCRVYLKSVGSSDTSRYLKIEGTYKLGGYCIYEPFKDELGLIGFNSDFTLNVYNYSTKFTGCTNLVEAPKLIAPYSKPGSYQSVHISKLFEGCSNLEKPPIILITGLAYNPDGSLYLDSLFSGCSKLTSEIVIKVDRIYSSAKVSATNWLKDVPIGTLVLNQLAYDILKSFIPSGWKIKISEMNSSTKYIKFTIDNASYIADDNMTWKQWVNSSYNTLKLSIKDTNIVNDSGTLLFNGIPVVSTDLVQCVTDSSYIINSINE